MANVRIAMSKKGALIAIIVLVLLLGGGGGYLLWRVNQKDTVAPTDSDASGGTCSFSPMVYYLRDGTEKTCTSSPVPSPEKPLKPGGFSRCLYEGNTQCGDVECGSVCLKCPNAEEACRNIDNPAPLPQYTLTYTAEGGRITGTATQTVKKGQNGTPVTAVPDNTTTHEFEKWSDESITNPRTDVNVQKNISVKATFKKKTDPLTSFTLKYIAGTGGTLKYTSPESGKTDISQPEIVQRVMKGGDAKGITAVPDSGYEFVTWSDMRGVTGVVSPVRQDKNVQRDITATAEFRKQGTPGEKVTLTYKAGPGGTIEGTTTQTVNKGGGGTEVIAKALKDYKFDKWTESPTGLTSVVIGESIPPDRAKSRRVDMKVQGNVTITASFKISCGDGVCDDWETMSSCPGDCEGCGDGKCVPPESVATCPRDCIPTCGEGICSHGETPETCPEDCPATCGDGICSEGESPYSCPLDCPSVCGDGMCTGGEDGSNCPADCGASGSVPDTGLFDETENILIMGGILLVLGIGWTWLSTLPKKAYTSISKASSEYHTYVRESRRNKLERRIK